MRRIPGVPQLFPATLIFALNNWKVPPEVEEERGELEEEQRAREEQALAARAEYQERIDAIRPGDYQLQVILLQRL